MKKIVITGGCGFLGHHVVEHFLKHSHSKIVVLDKLEHSNALDRLRDIRCFNEERVLPLACNLASEIPDGVKSECEDADVVMHIAAASHVDNSIANPAPFIQNNIMSTVNLLDYVRSLDRRPLFLYFSTDEVFGPAPDATIYREDDPHNPTNPYSASKSSSEQIVKAYANTYNIPFVITRCMNIFGERQHPEKYIPKIIRAVLHGDTLTIHADKTKTKAGSRFYIHARNVAHALHAILDADPIREINGQTFHIVGEREIDNLELASMVSHVIGLPLKWVMVDFHSSRPGHDLRYAMSGQKMRQWFGWSPPVHIEESLTKTVKWTLMNERWLKS